MDSYTNSIVTRSVSNAISTVAVRGDIDI